MDMILVDSDRLECQIISFPDFLQDFFKENHYFILEKQALSIFDTEHQMIFYRVNFVTSMLKFLHACWK